MIQVSRLPFMTDDFVVKDANGDLCTSAVGYSDETFSLVGSATFNGSVLFERRLLNPAPSHDTRFPIDSYPLVVRFDDYSKVGDLTLKVAVSGTTGETEDSVDLKVFPVAEYTETVSSDTELRSALITAKGYSGAHFRIQFTSGAYTFPTADDPQFATFDMSNVEDKLVSFEPAVGADVRVTNSQFWLRRAMWTNIHFENTSDRAVVVHLRQRSRHVFKNCHFQHLAGAFRSIGLRVAQGADARVESCVFKGLYDAVAGASVVRGVFWRSLRGVVFRNISRLLEGTVGYDLDPIDSSVDVSRAWFRIVDTEIAPVVRHNIVADTHPYALSMNSEAVMNGGAIAGNTFYVFGEVAWELTGFTSNYVVHNSVKSRDDSTSSLTVAGRRFSGNVFLNNYFSSVGEALGRVLSDNTWDYNATSTATNYGDNSIASADPGFANKWLLLTKNSALLNRSLPQAGMTTAFGSLGYQNQIGSMPYHPDRSFSAVMSPVITQPDFGMSLKDSADGDLVGPEPGGGLGGQFNFRDGSQSGWLAVI